MKVVDVGSMLVSDVIVGPRLRELDQDTVEVIAATLQGDRPLQNHITVRRRGNEVHLIAGHHRLEAHKLAKREYIPFQMIEDGLPEDEYLELEAIENLARRDLTVLDRAVHLGAMLKIEEARGRKHTKGGDRKSDQKKTFPLIGELANTMQVSRRTVNLYLSIAKALAPKVVERIKGTELADNYSELAALAAEEPKDQSDVLELKLSRKSPNIRAAIALHHNQVDTTTPDEKAFAAFVKLWGRASKKVRRQIINHVTKAEKTP